MKRIYFYTVLLMSLSAGAVFAKEIGASTQGHGGSTVSSGEIELSLAK